jgi:hypothetical protein
VFPTFSRHFTQTTAAYSVFEYWTNSNIIPIFQTCGPLYCRFWLPNLVPKLFPVCVWTTGKRYLKRGGLV